MSMTDDEIFALNMKQATGELREAANLLREVGMEHFNEHWRTVRART